MKTETKAPAFTLPDQDGKPVSLRDLAGKWVVLYFYPKDNTPGCTIEGREFTSYLDDFRRIGAEVLGVSPDSEKSHCNFIEKQGLKITLLSDMEKTVIKKYDAWGNKRGSEGVIRSTFLIAPDGTVARAWEKVKAEGHAEEVLEELKKHIVGTR
ncbi:MAG: peroxiredoxin [Nitrospinae bacterium]|nr:peroxiredoxin [Nitrospinota bacterium]